MDAALDQLRARARRTDAARLGHARSSSPVWWKLAATCLRSARADPHSIAAFMALSGLCQSRATAAAVAYFCMGWGEKELPLADKALIEWLCRKAKLTRPTFDAAFGEIGDLTGWDVRAFGPSTFEYILLVRTGLSKPEFVKAAAECLVRAQKFDARSAETVAAEILQAPTRACGYAGNLVKLLVKGHVI